MASIPEKLLHQRLRNRVIEVLEIASSPESIAEFGAFGTIDWLDDFLSTTPNDEPAANDVYTGEERMALARVTEAFEAASDVTDVDLYDAGQIAAIVEWQNLIAVSNGALDVFAKRGKFSEDEIDQQI